MYLYRIVGNTTMGRHQHGEVTDSLETALERLRYYRKLHGSGWIERSRLDWKPAPAGTYLVGAHPSHKDRYPREDES